MTPLVSISGLKHISGLKKIVICSEYGYTAFGCVTKVRMTSIS